MPDEDRELLLGEHDLVCPTCGNLRSVCSRDDVPWYPQRSLCNATAARQVAVRKFEAKHADEKFTPDEYHPSDGVSIWVSDMDLTPEDNFL